ncbi:unnamed protein product [Rotaria socialis]|uniref:DUF4781 domain-containing protein n=3 Tax=Rotaria socialis TaxID=392032 RepID=A0A817R3L3_9BILA|nr:unnamed protein product [Rotaria socialis]CAF4247323.1 unnamed protein product [Rotaria socialis]
MYCNGESSDILEWKKIAAVQQKNIYLMFSGRTWDSYKEDEYDFLAIKVAYALFGQPVGGNQNEITHLLDTYSNDQQNAAHHLKNIIINVYHRAPSMELKVATVFVSVKVLEKCYFLPVFRLLWNAINNTELSHYIDHTGRTYESWTDYLENNRLPKCMYCYPKYGFYSCNSGWKHEFDPNLEPTIEFGTSPACHLFSRTSCGFNDVSTVGGTATADVNIVSLSTPLTPVLLTADKAVDKGSQDDSPTDRGALSDWVAVSINAFHEATGAKTSAVLGSSARVTVTILNISTLCVDSLSTAAAATYLVIKGINEQLTTFDILQFSIGVFFFSNTLIQPKTAGQIIKRAQNECLAAVREDIQAPAGREAFDNFATSNRSARQMHDNERITESIRRINDPNEFFTSAAETNSYIHLTKDGLFNLSDDIDIHPRAFKEIGGAINPDRRVELLKATAKYNNGEITEDQYRAAIRSFRQNEHITFLLTREEIMNEVAKGFNTTDLRQVEISGRRIFENMNSDEVDRLGRVLYGRNYNQDIIQATTIIAKKRTCPNTCDFCSYVELICHELQDRTSAEKIHILNDLKNRSSAFFHDFNNRLDADLQQVQRLRHTAAYQFTNDLSGVYHFRKHGNEFHAHGNMRVYLHNVPLNLFSDDTYLFSAGRSHDGQTMRLVFANPENQQIGFLIQQNDGSGRQMASTFIEPGFFGSAEQWNQRIENAMINLQSPSFKVDSRDAYIGIDFSYLLEQQQHASENLELFKALCFVVAAFFK